jgi:hypothetical protein
MVDPMTDGRGIDTLGTRPLQRGRPAGDRHPDSGRLVVEQSGEVDDVTLRSHQQMAEVGQSVVLNGDMKYDHVRINGAGSTGDGDVTAMLAAYEAWFGGFGIHLDKVAIDPPFTSAVP